MEDEPHELEGLETGSLKTGKQTIELDDSGELLWSPWSPLGQEEACAFRQPRSLASFSTVTARRNPLHNSWGMELESEE
ncbi:Protein inca1 [Saguinus oedipus]|uniref:Protein inca1 n=1 Tax=Saguinus oedipus TaxID=9490 RepID=A0ABQ9VQZ5_SAGOE|nr:Protein inca1 [Saguinus oedipus]